MLSLVVTAWAFLPAADNAFVYWDDEHNFMFNPHIRGFSVQNLRRMWTSSLLGVWQPLTWFWTTLEYRLFDGADLARFSRGIHAVSIALQALATGLFFGLARRLLALSEPQRSADGPVRLNLAALAAAWLYGLHPLRAEPVAWASGQAYLLALVPAVLCVRCYLRAVTGPHPRRWHALALLCLTVSLLSKALAVPLVGVLLVLDVYPLRRLDRTPGGFWRLLLEKVPYVLVTLVVVGLTLWATWATTDYAPRPWYERVAWAAHGILFHARLTFWPRGLAPVYIAPAGFGIRHPWGWGAVAGFVVFSAVLFVFRSRVPGLLAAWGVHVLTLLPVVGLVQHGGQMAADRYTCLSGMAWSLPAGWVLLRLWHGAGGRPRWKFGLPASASAALLVAWLGVQTRAYCDAWQDTERLWTAMVARNPHSPTGYLNLAKAVRQVCPALEREARAALVRGDAARAGRLRKEAAERWAKAARLCRRALALDPLNPDANVELGNMMRAGRIPGGLEGALTCYAKALKARPDDALAHLNYAAACMQLGRFEQAARHLVLAETAARGAGDGRLLEAVARERARLEHLAPRP